ncbi:MAG: ZIP family metal transporter [Candidatus Gribaldobacteria bacterium]|nr:ZIP family metal transporter [Candidatus Gribaldobacteria bacterium]
MEAIIWFYTLISVVIVSLISLVGVFFLSFSKEKLKGILLYLVSFAVGGLFGDAFIHLLPEAFKRMPGDFFLPLYILLGILIFFVVEKVIRWRHCHIPEHQHHCQPAATMNLVGDGIHNFIDGVLIAASFSLSFPIGLATSLAVILHEIPQEIGDFGVLVHSGFSVKRALFYNFLSALTAVLGAVLALLIGEKINNFAQIMMPIAAGGFIYIAGSDLIPELHHDVNVKNSLKQLLALLLGVGVMLALLFVG